MYLALLKLFWLLREGIDWVHLHALRYFGHELIQGGYGNRGERAGKLPLSDWRYPFTIVLALFEAVFRMIWQVFRWLFFFNTRSVPEFFLSAVKLVCVLSVVSMGGLYSYLSGTPDPEILAEYQTLHQQNTATALLDKNGRLVGAMPNPQRKTASLGRLSIELVPPVYWDVLDFKTNRQLDFKYQDTHFMDLVLRRKKHYKGIAPTDLVAAINPFSKSSDNLVKRLSTSLLVMDDPESRCFTWFSDFCNTLSAIRLSRHAFPYLAKNNGSEFKRWVAMHNTLRGESDDFSGLRAAAETVFTKLPEQLNNAEQALLALAQLKQQSLLDVDSWDSLKSEAKEITQTLYQRDQNALALQIEKDLAALEHPKVVTRAQSERQSTEAILTNTNLRQRAESTLGGFAKLVQARLSAEYSRSGGGKLISDAQISLPVKDNLVFQSSLYNRLREFERRCGHCGFKRVLGEQPERSGAHIQVFVADQTGQIVRYFTRGEVKDRAIGALSSIPASVVLASKGNTVTTRFCNQTYRNLPSSVQGMPRGIVNCDTPEQAGHSLSFLESTQARASLPLFNALRKQVSPDEMHKLYADFALKDLRTRAGNASHAEQLAYEMSYGVVQSTPLQMLEMNHQVSEVLWGEGDPKALQSISQFLVSDMLENRRYLEFSESPSAIHLSGNYLRTQEAKDTLKLLLGDEVNAQTGSLRELRNIRNIRFLSTKTGQSYTKQQALRDQWLLASVLIRGKRYSISAFVGSAAEDQSGLAENLNAAEMFYPVVAEITDSLD